MRIVLNEQEQTPLSRQLLNAIRDALVSYAVFYVFDRLTGAR